MSKLYQYIEMFEYQLIIGHFPDLLLVIALDISPNYHMTHSATKGACSPAPSLAVGAVSILLGYYIVIPVVKYFK